MSAPRRIPRPTPQTLQEPVSEPVWHERECIHRRSGQLGEYYSGESYVRALKLLRRERAARIAGKVGAFYWSDAPRTRVWLCIDCAEEISSRD